MFNKLILVGNLTREIELRNTPAGLTIANTGIATNKKFKNQTGQEKEEVMFIDITFFGRTAEVANQYLKKGSQVLVDGRLKLDQWTDASGQKRSKHSLVVESMKMLGNRGSEYGNAQNDPYRQDKQSYGQTNYKQPISKTSTEKKISTEKDIELSFTEEVIPF